MSKKLNVEVPGNVLATAALTARLLERTGHRVHMAMLAMINYEEQGLKIVRITFKAPGDVNGEWLGIITAQSENGGVVAFHSGDGFVSTVEGLLNRLNNGSLKWKEDEYA